MSGWVCMRVQLPAQHPLQQGLWHAPTIPACTVKDDYPQGQICPLPSISALAGSCPPSISWQAPQGRDLTPPVATSTQSTTDREAAVTPMIPLPSPSQRSSGSSSGRETSPRGYEAQLLCPRHGFVSGCWLDGSAEVGFVLSCSHCAVRTCPPSLWAQLHCNGNQSKSHKS